MKTTELSGGQIPGATRIHAACWIDGEDDHIIVEFWKRGESILRTTYNRRTTRHRVETIDRHGWEHRSLMRMAQAQETDFCI